MLMWLMNLGFAGGGAAAPTEVFIEAVQDGASVSMQDSVSDSRFRQGTEGVSMRRQVT